MLLVTPFPKDNSSSSCCSLSSWQPVLGLQIPPGAQARPVSQEAFRAQAVTLCPPPTGTKSAELWPPVDFHLEALSSACQQDVALQESWHWGRAGCLSRCPLLGFFKLLRTVCSHSLQFPCRVVRTAACGPIAAAARGSRVLKPNWLPPGETCDLRSNIQMLTLPFPMLPAQRMEPNSEAGRCVLECGL